MNNAYLFHFSASICENMQNCCRIKGNFQFSVQGQLFQKMIMKKSKNVNHYHFLVRSEGKNNTVEVMSSHWSISLLSLRLKTPRSTKGEISSVALVASVDVLVTEKSRGQIISGSGWRGFFSLAHDTHPLTPISWSKGAEREEMVRFCQRMLLSFEAQEEALEVERLEVRGVDLPLLLLEPFSLLSLPDKCCIS